VIRDKLGAWERFIHAQDDLDPLVRMAVAHYQFEAIRACQEEIGERARAATIGGRDAQLLALLFEQPYCRIANVVERCEVTRQTASTWLHALVEAGLLQDVKVGRERLFVNHEFLRVLVRTE
jgi:Fic family protein